MKRPARIVAGPIAQRIGDALSVDVDVDADILPVSSPAEFDETGGWVLVVDDAGAEHVLEYVAVSDDELHVELAEPLPVALPAGRRVDVWDTTTAAPIVEYVADVVFDDQVEGDPVPAVVKAALIERLRGDLSGLAGSAVTIERRNPRPNDPDEDTELYVDEIDGQQSYLSLENADPDTAPDGLGGSAPTTPPAAPGNLQVTSTPDLAGRVPTSRFDLTWDIVVSDVEGIRITGVRYEIEQRPAGQEWRTAAQTDELTLSVTSFKPGQAVEFRVRAIRDTTTPGDWSPVVATTGAVDTTAPPTPSKPTASSRLGVARFGWGGYAANGGAMPTDLQLVELHVSTVDGFTPDPGAAATLLGALTGAGDLVKANAEPGTYYARLIARDVWGNHSVPSGQTQVTVTALVDVSNFPDDAMAQLYARTGHFLQLSADQLLANDALIEALETGTLLTQVLNGVEINGVTITGSDIIGALIRTAQTGVRWELGLNATANQILSYTGHQEETAPGGLYVDTAPIATDGVTVALVTPRLGQSSARAGLYMTIRPDGSTSLVLAAPGGSINLPTIVNGNAGTGAFFTDLMNRIVDAAVGTVRNSDVGTSTLRSSILGAVKTAIDTAGNALRTSVVDAVRASLQLQSAVVSTGVFTSTNTPKDVPVTFPTPYPVGTVPVVNAWPIDLDGVQVLYTPAIKNVTRTGFIIRAARSSGTGAYDMRWEAKLV